MYLNDYFINYVVSGRYLNGEHKPIYIPLYYNYHMDKIVIPRITFYTKNNSFLFQVSFYYHESGKSCYLNYKYRSAILPMVTEAVFKTERFNLIEVIAKEFNTNKSIAKIMPPSVAKRLASKLCI